jgi:hypothetical protein
MSIRKLLPGNHIACDIVFSIPEPRRTSVLDNRSFTRLESSSRPKHQPLSAGELFQAKKLGNFLSKTLLDVKREFDAGKKAHRQELLLDGYSEDEVGVVWESIHSLFIEVDNLLEGLYKHLKFWEKLLYLFTFFFFFSVFPNACRHLCTTMPWTIWPALAVLWGVCWMFPYSSSSAGQGEKSAQWTGAESADEFPPGKYLS